MSVWPETPLLVPSLSTAEGALVSVSIHVEPHCLESLLEALAQVSFPINPQIYHDAALIYRYADGREQTEPITLVEFPAYEGRLVEVRQRPRSLRLRRRLHTRGQHARRHSVGLAEGARARRRRLRLPLPCEAPRRARLREKCTLPQSAAAILAAPRRQVACVTRTRATSLASPHPPRLRGACLRHRLALRAIPTARVPRASGRAAASNFGRSTFYD